MRLVFYGGTDVPIPKPDCFSGIKATNGSQWVDYALTLQPDYLTEQAAAFRE